MNNIYPYISLICLLMLLIIRLAIEAVMHQRYLMRIPYRIHVNGTRGKSSVTRLIAAGLRAGGIKTVAKTTGTLASFIDLDGQEQTIFRIGHTNISEQIRIIRRAAKLNAQVLVIECMAVQPLLQSLSELKLVKSTHGVLTNARADHLDVMGPTARDVAFALAGTVPIRGSFFTSVEQYQSIFDKAAYDRHTTIYHVDEEEAFAITDQDMEQFAYEEYKINVALALKVCASLGVNRKIAFQGMLEAMPDPGALTIYTISYGGKKITLVNGFAANDPVSTENIWQVMLNKFADYNEKIILMNCRADRKQRSTQMAAAFVNWQVPTYCMAVGSYVRAFLQMVKKDRVFFKKSVPLINGEGWEVDEILQYVILNSSGNKQLLVGIGNIAGIGFKLLKYFREHAYA